MDEPYNSTEEVVGLIRAALLRHSALVELIGDNVRGEHAWDPNSPPPMPCLIIEETGGDGHYGGHLQFCDFVIYAYSMTASSEARRIYDRAYQALQMERLIAVGQPTDQANPEAIPQQAGVARETGRPRTSYNGALGAWYSRGTWTATLAG